MPEYLTPDVYIEEIGIGPRPIAAVPTATTAIVGMTPKGPLNKPVALQSFAEFREIFDPGSTQGPVSLAVWLFFVNGGKRAYVVRVAGGQRRGKPRPDPKAVIGDPEAGTGLLALKDGESFGLLLTPDTAEMSESEARATAKAALAFCRERRVFHILETPRRARSGRNRVAAAVDWAKRNAALSDPNAAVYFPHVSIPNPSGGKGSTLASPSGAIAGVYARTDAERGVWKAPADLDASLHGVTATEIELGREDMESLRPAAINPLRRGDAQRIVPWGALTFQPGGSDNEWKYVNVRRLFLFIEDSIYRGLQWSVFEPNAEPLWAQIRLSVSSFMFLLFRAGAFQGASANQAYFVKCGRDTMTRDDIESGRAIGIVGFAPLKPAEFVVLRFGLRTASHT